MSLIKNSIFRKCLSFALVVFLLVNVFWVVMPIGSVLGAPGLTLKWTTRPTFGSETQTAAMTNQMPLAADLVGDEKLEIIVSGGTTTRGAITVLNGTSGDLIWQTSDLDLYND